MCVFAGKRSPKPRKNLQFFKVGERPVTSKCNRFPWVLQLLEAIQELKKQSWRRPVTFRCNRSLPNHENASVFFFFNFCDRLPAKSMNIWSYLSISVYICLYLSTSGCPSGLWRGHGTVLGDMSSLAAGKRSAKPLKNRCFFKVSERPVTCRCNHFLYNGGARRPETRHIPSSLGTTFGRKKYGFGVAHTFFAVSF